MVQMQFINNRKFEGYARKRAYELLAPLTGIIDAFKQSYHSLYEMAIFLRSLNVLYNKISIIIKLSTVYPHNAEII